MSCQVRKTGGREGGQGSSCHPSINQHLAPSFITALNLRLINTRDLVPPCCRRTGRAPSPAAHRLIAHRHEPRVTPFGCLLPCTPRAGGHRATPAVGQATANAAPRQRTAPLGRHSRRAPPRTALDKSRARPAEHRRARPRPYCIGSMHTDLTSCGCWPAKPEVASRAPQITPLGRKPLSSPAGLVTRGRTVQLPAVSPHEA